MFFLISFSLFRFIIIFNIVCNNFWCFILLDLGKVGIINYVLELRLMEIIVMSVGLGEGFILFMLFIGKNILNIIYFIMKKWIN